MQHRIRLLSFMIASVLASAMAAHAAGSGVYFAGYMGLNVSKAPAFSQNESSKDSGFAGALGFHLAPRWRLEGEVSLKDDHMTRVSFSQAETPLDGRFKSWSGLVNVYHDFAAPGKIQPFLGFGAGYIVEETTSPGGSETGSFAWQLGGGLKYNFDPSLSFSSAYRYLDSAYQGVAAIDESTGHELHVGVSYKLPIRPQHHARGLNDLGK
jgi:opacity protein-like surface antigen